MVYQIFNITHVLNTVKDHVDTHITPKFNHIKNTLIEHHLNNSTTLTFSSKPVQTNHLGQTIGIGALILLVIVVCYCVQKSRVSKHQLLPEYEAEISETTSTL